MAEIKDKTVYKYENLLIRSTTKGLYEMYFSTGGKTPPALDGMYTSLAAAERARAMYITAKEVPKRAYRKRK